jgi:hypothetical protein
MSQREEDPGSLDFKAGLKLLLLAKMSELSFGEMFRN